MIEKVEKSSKNFPLSIFNFQLADIISYEFTKRYGFFAYLCYNRVALYPGSAGNDSKEEYL